MNRVLASALSVLFAALVGAIVAVALDQLGHGVGVGRSIAIAVVLAGIVLTVERLLMNNEDKKRPKQRGIHIVGGKNIVTRRNKILGYDEAIVDEDGESNTHAENDIS